MYFFILCFFICLLLSKFIDYILMVFTFLRQDLENQENQKLDAIHGEKLVDDPSLRIRYDNVTKV